jgi:putative NIF3 family GTP cyclohydrolase 1 type 2
MTIKEIIHRIKNYCKGLDRHGMPINDEESRDQVLFGDCDKECTGIVVTCFASTNVIRRASEMGANLIICHEALFWNHGDKTDWLTDNRVFQAKKKLLEETGITVWRNHDYIHSGIPIGNGMYADGIFYGFMKKMKWESFLLQDIQKPLLYQIPETTAVRLAAEIAEQLNLNGIRIVGDGQTSVKKVFIAEHIMGRGDNEKLYKVEHEDIDVLITLELTDSSVSEYIRDASQSGMPKAILAIGHFNVEEPGMEYMCDYLPEILGSEKTSFTFIQSGDTYSYVVRNGLL